MKFKDNHKSFELDISDVGDASGDDYSVKCFDDHLADLEEDLNTGKYAAASVNDQDGISFAHDDDADFPYNKGFLQGYKNYRAAHSPTEPQGFDENAEPDADYDPKNSDNEDEGVPKRSGKRSRTTVGAPSKSTQLTRWFGTTTERERSAMRTNITGSRSYMIDDEATMTADAPSHKGGTFGRMNHEKGSKLPSYYRGITFDLDSNDELILSLRDKGYSDQQICDWLKKEGRVRYNPKGVSTRIARIKQVRGERWDFELENGMREWKMEDDQLLLRAYDLADIEIAYEIERLRSWRWKKTADWMHRLNKDLLFSGNACHKRYAALIDGTAAIPTDVDADPAQRKAEMEKLRQDLEEKREKENEEKEAKENERQRLKEEAAIENSQKAVNRAEKKRSRFLQQEIRATKRATNSTLRSQQAEDTLLKKREIAAARQKTKEDKEAERKHREEFAVKNFKHITKDTPDPRGMLDLLDLQKLCRDRNISDYKPHKKGLDNKKVLLMRLRNADQALKHCRLVAMCQENKIPTGGNKVQMIHQLALCAARGCDSYVGDDARDDGDDEADDDEEEVMEAKYKAMDHAGSPEFTLDVM